MAYPNNIFLRFPGGDNEGSFTPIKDGENETTGNNNDAKEEKPLLDKIQDALQDWSNKDQADLDHDDRTP